ncbi:MAG: hypothetical protein AB1486_24535 [Planctomycetota bacterium]
MRGRHLLAWPMVAFLSAAMATVAVAAESVYDPNQELEAFRAHYQVPLRVEWDFAKGYVSHIAGDDMRSDWLPRTAAEFEAAAREIFDTYPGMFGFDSQALVLKKVHFLNLSVVGTTDKVAVTFRQEIEGIEVFGGRASVLFDHEGRILMIDNAGLPDLQDGPDRWLPVLTETEAIARASEAFGHTVGEVLDTTYMIYPLETDRTVEGRPAWLVNLRAVEADGGVPIQERLAIDARTGRLLGRHPTVYTFTDLIGSTDYWATPGTKPDTSSNPEQVFAADTVRMSSSVGNDNTDINGDWTITYGGGSNQSVTASFSSSSTYAYVDDRGDSDYSLTQTVTPGVPKYFEMNTGKTQYDTAEMNAQRCILAMLRWIWSIDPSDNTMAFKVRANTSLNNNCNAYWDGSSINFFRSGGGCVNTAYSTVVNHEEGHWAVDKYLGWSASGAIHEGVSDVWGMYVWDTNLIGEDFCGSGCHIRNGNNSLKKCSGDCNETCHGGGSHTEGQVIMGAFWKMRSRMNTSLGNTAGDLLSGTLFLGWMQTYNDTQICNKIYTHILELDDNDGNLNNGTPHCADIEGAFETDKGWPDLWDCSGGGGDPCPGTCVEPVNYGTGTAGSGGFVPHMTYRADLGCPYLGNEFFTERAERALGGAYGVFFLGFGRDSVDGGGWTLLVDINPVGVVFPFQFSGSGPGNGTWEITFKIPNNPLYLGMTICTQVTAADPGAPYGVAASEGLEAVVCN